MSLYHCSRCRQQFDESDMVYVENHMVCQECKPVFLQELRENVPMSDPDNFHVETNLSGFSKGWIITDLVFCSLRLLIGICSIIGLGFIEESEFAGLLLIYYILDVVSNWGIALFGIPGNAALLAKKKWGFYLCYAAIFFTLLNLLTAVAGIPLQMEDNIQTEALIGMIVGAGVVFIIRIVLNAFYIRAIIKARSDLQDLGKSDFHIR